MGDLGDKIGQRFDEANVRKPNLFIVGAPKCATTALAEAIDAHPDVFMSNPKEPHAFGADLPKLRIRTLLDPSLYAGLFTSVADQPVVGEASVWYLRSESAAKEIHSFNPDARIIVMLRNPVDMIASLHGEMCRSGVEHILDLREALGAETDRALGQQVRRGVADYGQLVYSSAVDYHSQLQRYLVSFGKASVHVILFDDVESHPAAVMERVQTFLQVPVRLDISLSRRNEGRQIRNARLQRFARQRGLLRVTSRRLVPSSMRPRIAKSVTRAVERVNVSEAARQPIPQDLRRELAERFHDQNLRLASTLARDLSGWDR